MNTPVKFEIAKLLKEKRFDIPTKKYYEYALKSKKDKENGYSGSFGWKKGELNLQSDYFQNNSKSDFTSEMWYMCSSPTIAEVVMWLYEKHGIWIVINPHKGEDDLGKPFMEFDPEVWSFTNKCILHNTKLLYFNSPIEAYEAAIEYVLNNLV